MSAPDLSTTITTAAGSPSAASNDGHSATARPIGDLITADQYLAVKAAMSTRRRGLRYSRIMSTGPAPVQRCGPVNLLNSPFGGFP